MSVAKIQLKSLPRSAKLQTKKGKSYHSNVKFKQNLIPSLVVFLVIQNVGMRAIKYFCREFIGVFISESTIRELVCASSKKASRLLQRSDELAGEKVSTLQVDTTWKGKKHKFFAAIDQTYHYLFEFKNIRKENKKR